MVSQVSTGIFAAYIPSFEQTDSEEKFSLKDRFSWLQMDNDASLNETDKIGAVVDWDSSSSSKSDNKLAQAAEQTAMSMGGYRSTGWCLKGVSQTLQKTYGVSLPYGSAYQAVASFKGANADPVLTKNFKEVNISKNELPNLPAGAIIIWDADSKHPHGHIAVSLGNGQEASDFVMPLSYEFSRESKFHVFVPK